MLPRQARGAENGQSTKIGRASVGKGPPPPPPPHSNDVACSLALQQKTNEAIEQSSIRQTHLGSHAPRLGTELTCQSVNVKAVPALAAIAPVRRLRGGACAHVAVSGRTC